MTSQKPTPLLTEQLQQQIEKGGTDATQAVLLLLGTITDQYQQEIKVITDQRDGLIEVTKACFDWIDAVPQDIQLPAMPGFDRDWAQCIMSGYPQDHEDSQPEDQSTSNPKQLPFQARAELWLHACFGEQLSNDLSQRSHRFLEEALELVQASDIPATEAYQLVDYVYGRPIGQKNQEVGGVMLTLAAYCLASKIDMNECAEIELDRVWTKIELIRQKQAAKPKNSPLPM